MAAEWAKKDQSAAERYDEALSIERAAAQEQMEKARRELAEEKKRLEQELRAREKELKEQTAQTESERQAAWTKALDDQEARLAAEAEAKRQALERICARS